MIPPAVFTLVQSAFDVSRTVSLVPLFSTAKIFELVLADFLNLNPSTVTVAPTMVGSLSEPPEELSVDIFKNSLLQ